MTPSDPTLKLFEPVLARLERDASAHFNGLSIRLVPAGLQERPFSHVLRLGVYSGEAPSPMSHLFVKVFKQKVIPQAGPDAMRLRVAHDFEATTQAYAAMAGYVDVGAVPPVACYPDLLAIATEQVEGPTLMEYLTSNAAWWPTRARRAEMRETMTRVGRWIRVFQATGPTGDVSSMSDLRHYIDIRLERLVQHSRGRFTDADRDRVLRHIANLGAAIAPEEFRQVSVHSDLSLGNLIVSGSRIVVLDFAMRQLDTWLHDVTKVFLQVGLLSVKPHVTGGVIAQLQSALLEGFDPSLTADRPLFRLIMLLHRVNHLSALYMNRAGFVQQLYNRAVGRRHLGAIAAELNRQIVASAV